MKYRCNNCGCEFDEAAEIKTTYEAYNGVSGLFPSSTPLVYEVCPSCHDECFEEICEDEEEE